MITAHVNEMGIVLRYSPTENLSRDDWEKLLDELKSHYIPSFYQFRFSSSDSLSRFIVRGSPGETFAERPAQRSIEKLQSSRYFLHC
jgi:hypothetical protein